MCVCFMLVTSLEICWYVLAGKQDDSFRRFGMTSEVCGLMKILLGAY